MKATLDDKISKCKQHDFILKPLAQNLHFHKKIQIRFCDGSIRKISKKSQTSKLKCCINYPIYNKDINFATPAFIQQSQQSHFIQNKKNYLKDHSRKVKQYEQIASDLYFPVPRSSHEYCNVCCSPYINYLQHISSFEHHKQIKTNKFNDYIIDLKNKINKDQDEKNGKRNFSDRYIQIEDDEQIQLSFHKKIKTQQKTDTTNNYQFLTRHNNYEYQQINPYNNINNCMFINQHNNMMNFNNNNQVFRTKQYNYPLNININNNNINLQSVVNNGYYDQLNHNNYLMSIQIQQNNFYQQNQLFHQNNIQQNSININGLNLLNNMNNLFMNNMNNIQNYQQRRQTQTQTQIQRQGYLNNQHNQQIPFLNFSLYCFNNYPQVNINQFNW